MGSDAGSSAAQPGLEGQSPMEYEPYPGFGDTRRTQFMVDGIPVPYEVASQLMDAGAVTTNTQGSSAATMRPGVTPVYRQFCTEIVGLPSAGRDCSNDVVGYTGMEPLGNDALFDHGMPQKSPLSGKRLENYNKQRDKARVGLQSSKCKEFLIAHGIDPDGLLGALNMQRAYDGLTSTISRGDAGFYRNEGVLESPLLATERNRSVESYFNKAPRGHKRGAVTGTYPGGVEMINNTTVADRSDVYYGKGGIDAAIILHEALHSYTGYSDSLLQFTLGIPTQDSTNNISNVLKKNGCVGK
jgi:hypothetical protein